MWAIANYYKDQEEDFEKYKILCRFINPEAAKEFWDDEVVDDTKGVSDEEAFFEELRKHTKDPITTEELKDRVMNPEKYDQESLDTIERVE
jgi:hypothetical protein